MCRLKYDVIKERAHFLESLIVDDGGGRLCIGEVLAGDGYGVGSKEGHAP